MNNLMRTIIKYVISLGTAVALVLLYRTVPILGDDVFDKLTTFNIIAMALGVVNMIAFVVAMSRWRKSGREIESIEKGSHAFLIAVALIAMEVGGVGYAGVIMDKQSGPIEMSVSECHVEDVAVMNKLRGYDKELVCNRPDGSETIFMIDQALADELADGPDELTVSYYNMTNRLISVEK